MVLQLLLELGHQRRDHLLEDLLVRYLLLHYEDDVSLLLGHLDAESVADVHFVRAYFTFHWNHRMER